MNFEILHGFSVLFLFCVFAVILKEKVRLQTWLKSIIITSILGLIIIVDMLYPLKSIFDFAVDGSGIFVGLSVVFFGPWYSLATFIPVTLCHIYLGQETLLPGVVAMFISYVVGLFFHYTYKKRVISYGNVKLKKPMLLMGLITQTLILADYYLLSNLEINGTSAYKALLLLIIYPLCTLAVGYMMEVWKNKGRAMVNLNEQKEEYRILVEDPIDMIVKVDMQGLIYYANKSFCKTFGKDQDKIVGSSFFPKLRDDDVLDTEQFRKDIFTAPYRTHQEHEMLTVYGWRWLDWICTSVSKESQSSFLYVAVGRDVTERKLIEQKMISAQLRYKSLIDFSPNPIFIDLNRNVIFANSACLDLFGYENISEFIGQNPTGLLFDEADQPGLLKQLDFIEKNIGKAVKFEVDLKKKDGEVLHVEIAASSFENDGQNAIHVIVHDITKRKRDEQAIQKQKNRLEKVERLSKMGGFEINYITGEHWWSPQMYRFVSSDLKSIFPTDEEICDMVHPDDAEYVKDCIQHFREGRLPEERDFRSNPKYGEIIYVSPTWRLKLSEDGKPQECSGTVHDVTERRQIEEALREREAYLSLTLMSIEDGVITTDSDGRINRMNKTACKLTEYNCSENNGCKLSNVFNVIDGTTKAPVIDFVEYVIKEDHGSFFMENLILVSSTGKEYHIELTVSPIKDTKGWINGLILVFSDVSERFAYQESLEAERSLLRSVIDSLPFSLYIKDSNCKKLLVNKKELEYLHLPLEEVIGKNDFDLFPNTYAEEYVRDDKMVLKGNPVYDRLEMLPDSESNGSRWLSTTKIPFYDKNHNIRGLIGFGIDVTQKVADDEQIRLLTQGVEQSPAAIIITDLEGTVIYVNSRYEEMTGLKAFEVYGQVLNILSKTGEDRDLASLIWNNIKAGRKWEGETLYRSVKGRKTWQSVQISPILTDKKLVTNYIVVLEDISVQKKMLNDLILARQKAEENDRLKSAFLANMSHEIRTPMNGILGFSDLLKDPQLTGEEQTFYIGLIEKSGRRMLNIINDIIDISKIEAGQMVVTFAPTDINEVLLYLKDFFDPEAEEKNIQLNCHLGLSDTQSIIVTDKNRFSQVLSNLIKNAMKFTTSGSIDFGYNLERQILTFYVKDSGIGIEPDKLDKIFERFVQGDLMLTRKFEGAGLGLSISKALVEKMGGNIWVISKMGEGSIFKFTLPYKLPAPDDKIPRF